ncbi:MAG TPA: VacB/RNase II family 3'-5' exoribonuclease [Terriglobales bacterium]|nr:VacB/RNase II family 3'-5' exoribonuclease [Terriglobales bacterium]
MLTDSSILRHIARQPKKAATHKQLLHEFGARGEARRELADRLYELVRKGELVKIDGRYAIPQAPSEKIGRNMLVGRLSMHRDGFGFVIPDAATLDASLKARLSGDVFIPPHATSSAMHGDRVLVEVTAFRPDGRAEGRVVRSVSRAHPTVVGIFHYDRRRNYVKPIDEKVSSEIVIPPGMEYPKPFTAESAEDAEKNNRKISAHSAFSAVKDSSWPQKTAPARDRVIGDQAARHTEWVDLDGVVVDVEITDWPSATQNPRGRVIEILGEENDFGVDVEIMIRKFHLPHRFPAEVIAEAEAIEPVISSAELRGRRDYRSLPIVTIDGETARDFDDAVHVRMLANGNYELQVHIADVAQYVTADSVLDGEARLRGTSVYFPDRAVPMLPLELSTDICSLRPQVDRLVLSCTMEIDHRGEIVGYEINEGVIRSAERMTYTAVNAVLEGDADARTRYAALVGHFELMRDLAQILNRKRERRGSIDFDLPEPVIEFDEFGLMKSITRSERNFAHRLIEEFMLSANECVAHYLENKRIASLYRIHEKPDAKRVYDFEVIAATFGYSLGVGALPIERMQMKTDRRAAHGTGKRVREIEVPKEVHITPRMYQKLTAKIAGKPEERILSFLMLRSLRQARYSEENAGHFALAATTYTHFTSPIRRYPDLIVHRILKSVLRDSPEKREGGIPVGSSWGLSSAIESSRPARATDSSHSVQERPFRAASRATSKGALAPEAMPSPWSKRRDHEEHRESHVPLGGPIPIEELHAIAEESSQSERRADDAERELMEWKKAKFMERRVGEEFDGLIISVTKFGFFVELTDLFVEGLVPLNTLEDDRYTYHENTRQIIGQGSRKSYSLGDRVRVLVDRIDPVEKKIQFAVVEEKPLGAQQRRR